MSDVSPVPLILAIEDDAAIRTVYAELLGDEGYNIITWGMVQNEDLDAVVKLAPALIILDLVISGQALGWRFFSALHHDARTTKIPVLVVTAAGSLVREFANAIEEWGCGLLPKPFDLDDLLRAVEDCLSPDSERVAS